MANKLNNRGTTVIGAKLNKGQIQRGRLYGVLNNGVKKAGSGSSYLMDLLDVELEDLRNGDLLFWDGDKQKWTNGDTCDIYMAGTDVISGSSPEQSADESCTIVPGVKILDGGISDGHEEEPSGCDDIFILDGNYT